MSGSDILLQVAANVAFQTVGEGIFLITPDNALHEAKGPVAQLLWKILSEEGPIRPTELSRRVVQEFQVDEEEALADIVAFVDHAHRLGLVEEASPKA